MKIKQRYLAFALLWSVFPMAVIAEIDTRSESEIRILCEQLFADYAIYIDHLNADGFANTFTPDGVFWHGDEAVHGREKLQRYIEEHGNQAHMIMFTTIDIDIQSESQASGVGYAVILNGNRQVQQDDAPIQMQGITAASQYMANFQLTDEGWKISSMAIEGKFRGPGYL